MYYFAEDLLFMIMRLKENTEDKTQTAQYELEVTEQRIFPKAYDECQAILKNSAWKTLFCVVRFLF